jgi:lysophospholipase L1-like esterase
MDMIKTSIHPQICTSTQLLFVWMILFPILCVSQKLHIQSKVKFLALGDSYTIGESVSATERWPVQLVDSLENRGLDCFAPQIIATTGWTTDNLKAAITNANLKNEYNLVSLLIGVNNYYQGAPVKSYGPKFQDLLVTAIALAKGNASNVFVVTIPDYGYTPFGENNQATISAGIDQYNNVNDSISTIYNVPYFYITTISRKGIGEPDLVAGDGLHPSGKQYAQWVGLIMAGSEFNQDPADTSGVVTGIKKEPASVNVYPNPFHQQLIIDGISSFGDPVTIRVFNQFGQPMISSCPEISGTRIELATENLPPGFYVYQITGSDGNKVGKILKY